MENETVLENEIDVDEEYEQLDGDEEENFSTPEDEDEFEYDEDGNIVIPDVVYDDDAQSDTDVDSEEDEKSPNDPEGSEEAPSQPDERDKEIASLRRELSILRAQGKDTLAKLGVEEEDVLDGLVRLAAEADDTTPQEYLKKREEAEREEQARIFLRNQEFERIARADLAELQSAYPETKEYKDIRDLPDEIKQKFGRFRERGLSAKEAYAAANPDGIRDRVATAVKRASLHDTKNHLRSAVPKGSKDSSVVMPKSDLSYWRDLFPDKSDKEIISLYKSTKK